MKCSLVFAFLLAFVVLSDARIFLDIDTFSDLQLPTILVASGGGDLVAPYDWWSPYYVAYSGSGGAPEATFFDTPSAVGGQRDSVLGYESATPQNSVAVISIVGNAASVAFPLKYVGGAYFQWDGDDAAGGATAFPGAIFNTLPGLGSGEPDSIDGQTIDFTYGGRAAGIFIEVTADHDVFYFMDCLDSFGVENTYAFVVEIVDEDSVVQFFFRFDDPTWDTPAFDFSDVAGFQVRIFTFSDGVLAGADNAIDTEFRFLRIFGFEVSGNVILDCLCDQATALTPVFNERVNLFNFGNPTVIDFVFTDVTGFYLFNDQSLLLNGNDYTVCLDNQLQSICVTSPFCIDFSLINFIDVTNLDFFLTTVSTLSLPSDVSIECGDCTDPACTGFATVDGCGSGSVQLNTFVDNTSVLGCVTTILRTWTDPDTLQSGVQTIILTDTQSPIIVTPASDSLNNDCNTPTETLASWTSRFAGATATDCSGFSFSFPPVSIGPCNTIDVTFTATDICGFSASTTATYSTVDNFAPTYIDEPTDSSAECNLKTGSSDTALTAWINSNAFSTVQDNCHSNGQLAFADDFIGFPSSCFGSEIVTFSVTDPCGNIALGTASFTISDTQSPSIVTPAGNVSIECSSVVGANDSSYRSWLAIQGGAVATDDCIANDNNLSWVDNSSGAVVGGANTCSQVLPITFTVTDDCGLFSSTTASFTIADTQSPFITAPAVSENAQCDGTGNVADFNAWISRNADATVADACDSGISFSNDNTGPPALCGENVSVTFSATDSCVQGTVSTTATFTIIDNVSPFFVNLPQDVTSECGVATQDDFDLWLSASAFSSVDDACSSNGLSISNNYNGNPISVTCNNVITVGFTALDSCGNSSPTEFATFTVVDTFDPTFTNGSSNEVVECDLGTNQAAYNAWLSSNAGATATDSCSGVSFSNDAGPIASGCLSSNTVIFTVIDTCGNFAMTTASFTIQDTTAPTVVSPAADLSVECNGSGNVNDINNFLNSRAGFTLTDSCSAIVYTNDFVAMSGGCVSTADVTFEGCDSCGFCGQDTARITISDTIGPSISPAAANQNVECDPYSNSNAFQDFLDTRGGADAFDVCDNTNLVWTEFFTDAPSGCDSEIVTFTVTDACGSSASTTATFTIFDSVAPAFNPLPSDLSVECDGFGNVGDYASWVSSFAGSDATDACAIFLTFSSTTAVDGPVGCGVEVGSFTVEDECLNAATATAVYRVVDTIAPTIFPIASDLTVECDITVNTQQLSDWLANNAGAVATDSCYGSNVSFSNNFNALIPGVCTSSATVEFRATDPCGQFSVTTATFTIDDTVAPIITVPASDSLFECDSTVDADVANYIATRGSAEATDSCSFVTWTNDFVSAPLECQGPDFVTFTATDACGNFASTTGSIEIDDTIVPSFSNFPPNRIIVCDQSSDPSQTGTPIPGDACDGDVDMSFFDFITQEPDERLCPGDTIITRTWTAIDDCGNVFNRDQIITITLPVGTCIPTECPPCGSQLCCESSVVPVPCNPVECNPVPCQTTSCGSVPCLPVVCGGNAVPIFDDDDDTVAVPTVTAAPQALDCDPIYIYVFDDDEIDNGDPVPYLAESSSNASGLAVSFFVLLATLLVWM